MIRSLFSRSMSCVHRLQLFGKLRSMTKQSASDMLIQHNTRTQHQCLLRSLHTGRKYILHEKEQSKDGFRVISPTSSTTTTKSKTEPATISVTFNLENGECLVGKGRVGDSLLDVVVDNDLDIDGFGACEGTLSCSTCHLVLEQQDFDRIPNRPSDEEMDMLDLAYDLTDTSRLGCQIFLTKDMDGLVVKVPASVNDVRLT